MPGDRPHWSRVKRGARRPQDSPSKGTSKLAVLRSLVATSRRRVQSGRVQTDIAIIGTGFGGLGTAIRLKQEGVEDFVVLERVERRRRHLARQHLPRLRVRRRVAPLLVLVRARTRSGPARSRRSRRSGATCSAARATSGSCRTSASITRSRRRAWDERAGALADRRRRAGTFTARRARHRRRAAERAVVPDLPGLERVRGAGPSTPRGGTTSTTSRASASR